MGFGTACTWTALTPVLYAGIGGLLAYAGCHYYHSVGTRSSTDAEAPNLKLYVYDHCASCASVRAILGLKGIQYKLVFLPHHDETTPIGLVGSKQVPILQLPSGEVVSEKIDIVHYVDQHYGDSRILAPLADREDLQKWTRHSAYVFHTLYYPRAHDAPFPEFAQRESRAYYRVKKEKGMGLFKDALAKSPELVVEANAFLKLLEPMLYSIHSVNATLSYDDIDLFGRLRKLTLVKGINWPTKVRTFVEYMSEAGDTPLLDSMAVQ